MLGGVTVHKGRCVCKASHPGEQAPDRRWSGHEKAAWQRLECVGLRWGPSPTPKTSSLHLRPFRRCPPAGRDHGALPTLRGNPGPQTPAPARPRGLLLRFGSAHRGSERQSPSASCRKMLSSRVSHLWSLKQATRTSSGKGCGKWPAGCQRWVCISSANPFSPRSAHSLAPAPAPTPRHPPPPSPGSSSA